MKTIDLSQKDRAFLGDIEAESGQKISSCYQCGNCTAGCPAGFVFDMPVSRIIRAVQLGQKEAVLGSESLWMCLSCGTCTERCPNSIDVAAVMETLRHAARREGRANVKRVDQFWTSFIDVVSQCGRSYEIGVMALYMLRSMRIFTDLDLAPTALLKQKLGLKPHMTPNGGAEAVGRIVQRYAERAAAAAAEKGEKA